MRQIFLQKLFNKDNTSDDSSLVESATKPRICDLQEPQDPYALWQNKNKGKRKEPRKALTFGKNQGHYLNKKFSFTGEDKTAGRYYS